MRPRGVRRTDFARQPGAKLGGDTAPIVFAALRGAGRAHGRAQAPKLTFEPDASEHVASQSRAGRCFGAPVRPPRHNDLAPEPGMLRVGMSDAGEAVATWLSSTDDSDGMRVRVPRTPPPTHPPRRPRS